MNLKMQNVSHSSFVVRFPELDAEWRVARANDAPGAERPVYVARSETQEDAARLLAVFEHRGWKVSALTGT